MRNSSKRGDVSNSDIRGAVFCTLTAVFIVSCFPGHSGGGTDEVDAFTHDTSGLDFSISPDTGFEDVSDTSFDTADGQADAAPDLVADGQPDSPHDATPDSPHDVTPDRQPDAQPDVLPDSAPDAQPDVQPDVVADLAHDAPVGDILEQLQGIDGLTVWNPPSMFPATS